MQESDRRAVVTGAASGIGLAVARRLLAEGVAVTAVDVNEAGLATIGSESARVLVANLGDPDQHARVIEEGASPHGAARQGSVTRRMRGANLVSVESSVRLHDGPGNQLHRRARHLVKEHACTPWK